MQNTNIPLIPITLFYLLCAIVGCIGNGIMIALFFREKKFNSPCHYFITLMCVSDFLHVCGHYVFNFHLFANITSRQDECFWLMLIAVIGLFLSSPLILATGIDRFLASNSPLLYRQIANHPRIYLFIQLVFPIGYTIVLTGSAFIQRNPNLQILCQMPLALSGTTYPMFSISAICINSLVVIVYFLTFLKLRSIGTEGAHMKAVFKSILCTVSFAILGWATVAIGNLINLKFIENKETRRIFTIHTGIGLNMACAANVFVYYNINTEYREAIRRLLSIKTRAQVTSVYQTNSA